MPTPLVVPSAIPAMEVFSQAMISGDRIYVSGNIGCTYSSEEGFKLVSGGVQAQTEAALQNIKRVLEAGGSSLHDVIKVNIYLTNMDNFNAMNEVYAKFFKKGSMPARTCIGVMKLPFSADVEMECVAEIPKK